MNARTQRRIGVATTLVVLLGSVSCGKVSRQGRSPSIVVIESLEGASGAAPGVFGNPALSDVVTLVKGSGATPTPTFFNDLGQVVMRITLKDPGTQAAPTFPSPLNAVTLTRYHVEYVRADGRNQQGVDVPYAFDGAITGTVTTSASSFGFEIVRSQAKLEAPLKALQGLGGRIEISTLANVTFYGADLAGNEVQVTGYINVDFADFGDPS